MYVLRRVVLERERERECVSATCPVMLRWFVYEEAEFDIQM